MAYCIKLWSSLADVYSPSPKTHICRHTARGLGDTDDTGAEDDPGRLCWIEEKHGCYTTSQQTT